MRGRHHEAGHFPMPVDLHDILQALVDEQQLRRQILHGRILCLRLCITLQGQVPLRNLNKNKRSIRDQMGDKCKDSLT